MHSNLICPSGISGFANPFGEIATVSGSVAGADFAMTTAAAATGAAEKNLSNDRLFMAMFSR